MGFSHRPLPKSKPMKLPDILHPKKFIVNGYTIQVASYMALTDAQAAKIAMHCYRSRKWLKKDLKKVFVQYWSGDADSLALLG